MNYSMMVRREMTFPVFTRASLLPEEYLTLSAKKQNKPGVFCTTQVSLSENCYDMTFTVCEVYF